MKVKIVMTAIQHMWLLRSLFPTGSSDEHFGCGITGVSTYPGGCNLLLRRFIPADESCLIQQSGASVRPDPRYVEYVWTLAQRSSGSLIDFHTHPFCDRQVSFSSIDDRDARNGFPRMVARLGDGPHASVVLGTSSLDAQWYDGSSGVIRPITEVRILGENLQTIIPTSADGRLQDY